MVLAALSGLMLLAGFLVFFYNIAMSLGIKGIIGIFRPATTDSKDLLPQTA